MLNEQQTSKKIYLIRHGETTYNKLGLVQGSGIDSDLNEEGREQALAFFNHYQHIPFDKVYTSKLKRTHQSVQSFLNSGLPWQQLEGLNEMSWGYKEGKVISDADNEQYINMLLAWNHGDYTQKVPGGESPLEVQERQKLAWEYIMSNEHEQHVLVCMHGRAIRILLCLLLGVPLKEMDNFQHRNLCLYLLSYQNGTYSIEKTCDTEHLTPQRIYW
jgi:probable phosphoglycerate mutase